MDLFAALEQLRHHRDRLDEAILSLERMTFDAGKRRGKPPRVDGHTLKEKGSARSPTKRKAQTRAGL